jgi:hypothetical protein
MDGGRKTMENAGVRLRPMGVGDVVDETFRLWRRHFVTFVVATAVVVVPATMMWLLFTIPFVGYTESMAAAGRTGRVPGAGQVLEMVALMVGVAVPLTVVSVLAYLVNHGALVRLASEAVLGQPLQIGVAYRAAFGRLLSTLWASILVSLAVGLLLVTVIGTPVAIYLGVGWALYLPAIMIEGTSGRPALSRSSSLVGGHRWRMLGILIVLWLITWVLTSVPSGLIGAFSGVAALSAGPAKVALDIVSYLLSAVIGSIFGSVPLIASTLLFYELRVRKEAFDIEQRLVAAEQSPPASPAET